MSEDSVNTMLDLLKMQLPSRISNFEGCSVVYNFELSEPDRHADPLDFYDYELE